MQQLQQHNLVLITIQFNTNYKNNSVQYTTVPSSNFVDFIHCASRICLGQNVKDLVWRRRQICPLKTNIFTLNALISTNEVSMFNLAIEVCFENHFGLIHAIFLSLGSSKSVNFFGTPGKIYQLSVQSSNEKLR